MYSRHLKYDAIHWQKANVPFLLRKEAVHLWKYDLSISVEKVNEYLNILSNDEINRANRFRFEKDRTHFIATRGALRILLGKYLNLLPHSIQFTYNDYGKPFFENHLNLQFNVSHSKGIALLAFTYDADIGVDLEPVNRKIDVQKLAARFFSENEAQTVLSLAYKDQFSAFFRCWTRKEAFIKAHGEGLSLALDSFEVSVLKREKVEMRAIRWAMEEMKEWHLFSFEIEKDLMAGLSIRKEIIEIKFLKFCKKY